ncbi:MAG TPA: hypothetical protein EYM61_00620 [Deltaproteobacteria bacterium]|nr:hypothetical protein [Deltaproteobacteria bacterium]
MSSVQLVESMYKKSLEASKYLHKWKEVISGRYQERELHHPKDTTGTVPPVKMDKFSGFDFELTIYEFIEKFEKHFQQSLPYKQSRAQLLFGNYLHPSVQIEMKFFEHNYDILLKQLILRYGSGDMIASKMTKRLLNIQCTGNKSQDKADFLRKIQLQIEFLQQSCTKIKDQVTVSSIETHFYQQSVMIKIQDLLLRVPSDGTRLRYEWLIKNKFKAQGQILLLRETSILEDDHLDMSIISQKDLLELFRVFLKVQVHNFEMLDREFQNGMQASSTSKRGDRRDYRGNRGRGGEPRGGGRGTPATHNTSQGLGAVRGGGRGARRGAGRGAGRGDGTRTTFSDAVNNALRDITVPHAALTAAMKQEVLVDIYKPDFIVSEHLTCDILKVLNSFGQGEYGANKKDDSTLDPSGIEPKNGKANKLYDGSLRSRCLICTDAHEMFGCKTGMTAGNQARMEAAVKRKVCHFCLKRSCYAKRMFDLLQSKDPTQWDNCHNKGLQIPCPTCVKVKKATRKNCTHVLLCTHHVQNPREVDGILEKRGKPSTFGGVYIFRNGAISNDEHEKMCKNGHFSTWFGGGTTSLTDGGCSDLFSNTAVQDCDLSSLSNGKSILKQAGKTESDDRQVFGPDGPDEEWISDHNKNVTKIAINTKTGEALPLLEIQKQDLLVKEDPKCASVYWLQMIKVLDHVAMVFYDNGSNGGCVVGRLAKAWDLEVIDPRPQWIIGAGGNCFDTGFHKYRINLGPDLAGRFFEISLIGLHTITGQLPLYNLERAWKDVKAYDDQNKKLLEHDKPPISVGGLGASILVGVNSPQLHPKSIFTHPIGIMLSRSAFCDMYGSRLMFGGPHASFKYAEECVSKMQKHVRIPHRMSIYKMALLKHPLLSDIVLEYRNSIYDGCKQFSYTPPSTNLIDHPDSSSSSEDNSEPFVPVGTTRLELSNDIPGDDTTKSLDFASLSVSELPGMFVSNGAMLSKELSFDEEVTIITEDGRIYKENLKNDSENFLKHSESWFEDNSDKNEDTMGPHACGALVSQPIDEVKGIFGEKIFLHNPYISDQNIEPLIAEGNTTTRVGQGTCFENSSYLASSDILQSYSIDEFEFLQRFDQAGCFSSKPEFSISEPFGTTQNSEPNGPLVSEDESDDSERLTISWSLPPTAEIHTPQANFADGVLSSHYSDEQLWRNDDYSEFPGMLNVMSLSAAKNHVLTGFSKVKDHTCAGCSCFLKDDIENLDVSHLANASPELIRILKLKKLIRLWESLDEIGTLVDYRCVKCQNCPECKKSKRTRAISIREEDEQIVIEKSVRIEYAEDIGGKKGEQGKTFVSLPFIKDPIGLHKLWGSKSNYNQAYRVLQTQLKLDSEAKSDIIAFHQAIIEKGFCQPVSTLPKDLQEKIFSSSTIQYFCWRGAWKKSSITTPCRMVVDPRMSGLNEYLAKGINTLNNLQQIMLEFRSWPIVATYDIHKMYNSLFIEEASLCYQLYLWTPNLDPNGPIIVMVFTRAMYGVVSSGNQSETGIRRCAMENEIAYPLGARAIKFNQYVDDGLPGADSLLQMKQIQDEVRYLLYICGFIVKVWTTVGDKTLSEKASDDGETIGVCGFRWHVKEDLLGLAFGEINFNKSHRGKRKQNPHKVTTSEDLDDTVIPGTLTRRDVVSQCAQLYDLVGLLEPIKARLKLDLAALVDMKLTWDDLVPSDLVDQWKSNFGIIQDSRLLTWKRCIVPSNAVDPYKLRLIDVHDAAENICIMAIYAGFELDDGSWSNQLFFSRSTLSRLSIPRNELISSLLGAQGMYIAQIILGDKVISKIAFGDSSIVTCWECNIDSRQRMWLASRVREIRRLGESVERFHVPTDLNCVDIGTRGLATLTDINADSVWYNGHKFMSFPLDKMLFKNGGPLKTYEEISGALTPEQKSQIGTEELPEFDVFHIKGSDFPELKEPLEQLCLKINEPDIQQVIANARISGATVVASIEVDGEQFDFVNLQPMMVQWQKDQLHSTTESSTYNNVGLLQNIKDIFSFDRLQIPTHPSLCDAFSSVSNDSHESDRGANVIFSNVLTAGPRGCTVIGNALSKLQKMDCSNVLVIDPVYYGWKPSNLRLAIMYKFINNSIHAAHVRIGSTPLGQSLQAKCKLCVRPDFGGSVNFGYLDQLHDRVKECADFEILERIDTPVVIGKIRISEFAKVMLIRDRRLTKRTKRISGKLSKKTIKQVKEAVKRQKLRKERSLDPNVGQRFISLSDLEFGLAYFYFVRVASLDFESRSSSKILKTCRKDQNGVWFSGNRLLTRDSIDSHDMDGVFLDLPTINFLTPVILVDHPVAYAFLLSLHWDILPHRGIRAHHRALDQTWSIKGARQLLYFLKRDCKWCRILHAKTVDQKMGNISKSRICIAPPFYSCQADVMSPLLGYSAHHFKSVLHLFALAIICNVTGCVSLFILEKEDTAAITKAILRQSYRYGFPRYLFVDMGTSMKSSAKLTMDVRDLQTQLNRDLGMQIRVKATMDHSAHGRVEQCIHQVRKVFRENQLEAQKQSIISWETTLAFVANTLNNLPIARVASSGQVQADRDELEVITKNRLLLGRNNNRSPEGDFEISCPGRRLDKIREINRTWYRALLENLGAFVPIPKWFKSSEDCKVGDLVMFLVREGEIIVKWQLGILVKRLSKEDSPVVWEVRYKNASEEVFRKTPRSIRELTVVHSQDDLEYNSSEHFWSYFVSTNFFMETENSYESYCDVDDLSTKL